MSDSSNECPLCSQKVAFSREDDGAAVGIDCPRCGKFKLYVPLVGNLSGDNRFRLAGLTREATELQREPMLITLENLKDLTSLAPKRIPERALRLLAALERRTTFFGEPIDLELVNDVPLAYARNPDEFRQFVNYLHDAGLIRRGSWTSSPRIDVTLTAAGFETLEARNPSTHESNSVFVAMSFDDSLNGVFQEGIKAAIEIDCGFRAVRIDLEEHNDDIVDRVLAEIRTSRFLVAEFTNHRNGVYFEAGYALALPIPVIWLCRNDEMGCAHFDTEHFNHIVWTDTAELRRRLASRICATIGLGRNVD